jgi:hypothetical protein
MGHIPRRTIDERDADTKAFFPVRHSTVSSLTVINSSQRTKVASYC